LRIQGDRTSRPGTQSKDGKSASAVRSRSKMWHAGRSRRFGEVHAEVRSSLFVAPRALVAQEGTRPATPRVQCFSRDDRERRTRALPGELSPHRYTDSARRRPVGRWYCSQGPDLGRAAQHPGGGASGEASTHAPWARLHPRAGDPGPWRAHPAGREWNLGFAGHIGLFDEEGLPVAAASDVPCTSPLGGATCPKAVVEKSGHVISLVGRCSARRRARRRPGLAPDELQVEFSFPLWLSLLSGRTHGQSLRDTSLRCGRPLCERARHGSARPSHRSLALPRRCGDHPLAGRSLAGRHRS